MTSAFARSKFKNIMDQLRYTIFFQPEPEGGFTVAVPALPGCVTYGRDLEEVKKMAVDAIGGYLASVCKHQKLDSEAV